ncbi:MAG TPA: hypothetical protein VFT87_03765 [Candidatus Saccharimonadales bacterium]|nr:hypothetical protein [Candidatus Saccharimonadales bacterium]
MKVKRTAALLLAGVLLLGTGLGVNATPSSVEAAGPATTTDNVKVQKLNPVPPGVVMPKPFLKMFFKKSDASQAIFVPNGFLGALDEIPIVDVGHDAIDINLVRPGVPNFDHGYGKPIYAGAPGRAYWSYQRIPFQWTNPETGQVDDQSIGGLVAEVRYSSDGGATWNGWVGQYFHFSRINPALNQGYFPPVQQGPGQWFPAGLIQSNEALWAAGIPVQTDTIIGWMGNSGLNKNCVEAFDVATGTVGRCPSWDEPHLHYQLYGGRNCTQVLKGEVQLKLEIAACTKVNIIDPAAWWAQVSGEWGVYPRFNIYTPWPGVLRYGPKSVFLTENGQPLYATN